MTLHLWTVLVRSLLVSCQHITRGVLLSRLWNQRCERPGEEGSLTDDSLHVDSVGKVFAGQLLAYYPRCALFEISGCLTSWCGIRDIIYSYIYHHIYFMLRV